MSSAADFDHWGRRHGRDVPRLDLPAKVTGAAKYAEDFRPEGLLRAKLLLSPYPHARVKNIDTSAAMKIKGVVGIITAADVPQFLARSCFCFLESRYRRFSTLSGESLRSPRYQ